MQPMTDPQYGITRETLGIRLATLYLTDGFSLRIRNTDELGEPFATFQARAFDELDLRQRVDVVVHALRPTAIFGKLAQRIILALAIDLQADGTYRLTWSAARGESGELQRAVNVTSPNYKPLPRADILPFPLGGRDGHVRGAAS